MELKGNHHTEVDDQSDASIIISSTASITSSPQTSTSHGEPPPAKRPEIDTKRTQYIFNDMQNNSIATNVTRCYLTNVIQNQEML